MEGKEEEVEKQKVAIANFKKEVKLAETALAEERDRRRDVKKVAQEAEKKASVVETRAKDAASQALVEFCISQEFEDEITVGSTLAYKVSFEDCKAANHLYLEWDLNEVRLD